MQQLENFLLWIWKHRQPDTVLATSLVTNAHTNSQATVRGASLHLYLYLGCFNLGTCSLEIVSQSRQTHVVDACIHTNMGGSLLSHTSVLTFCFHYYIMISGKETSYLFIFFFKEKLSSMTQSAARNRLYTPNPTHGQIFTEKILFLNTPRLGRR